MSFWDFKKKSPDAKTLPAPVENRAKDQIDNLSDAVNRIAASGMTHNAMIVLVADASGKDKATVTAVLSALPKVRKKYFR